MDVSLFMDINSQIIQHTKINKKLYIAEDKSTNNGDNFIFADFLSKSHKYYSKVSSLKFYVKLQEHLLSEHFCPHQNLLN